VRQAGARQHVHQIGGCGGGFDLVLDCGHDLGVMLLLGVFGAPPRGIGKDGFKRGALIDRAQRWSAPLYATAVARQRI
jgi:hypothetical protein